MGNTTLLRDLPTGKEVSASVNHSQVEVVEADLEDPAHQQAIVTLVDEYARLPYISGKGLPSEVLREMIPGLRRQPTTHVFLAFYDQRAVGVAVCFQGFSTFAAKPLMNIHDLAVTDGVRGRGIGQALLAAVEAKARNLGCCKLTLEVDEHNQRARRSYQLAGFEPAQHLETNGQALFMKKSLQDA